MKILLIAYSYPPLQDAQSLRWYYISKYLAIQGYSIDVVTISHPDEAKAEFHKNIKVHRVFSGFFEHIANKTKQKIDVDGNNNQEKRKKNSFKFMKKIYWFVRKSFEFIVPGNIATEWYFFALGYIKKSINLEEYEYLITSHEPWVDSLLGMKLKSMNKSMIWLGDFGDPYVSMYTPKHKLFFENFLEKKIYKKLDMMILTNNIVKEILLNKYDFLREKNILILEQGFEAYKCEENKRNDIFTIVYTGTFYEDFRNPLELSKALKNLDFDFKFILIGRNEKFVHLFEELGNSFEFKGFVEHNKTLEYQKNADLLIHLSNKQIEQVPGKFYEYLAHKYTPLLVIYQNEKDQLIKLTKSLDCGVLSKNRSEDIALKIDLIFKNKIEKEFNYNKKIDKYSWENRAKILSTFMNGNI